MYIAILVPPRQQTHIHSDAALALRARGAELGGDHDDLEWSEIAFGELAGWTGGGDVFRGKIG